MDYNNHNTTLRTNKHLNFEERFYSEKRIILGDSIAAISRALGRSRITIYTELKRGTVIQIRQGKSQLVYLANSGRATYERQRVGSFNTMRKTEHVLSSLLERKSRLYVALWCPSARATDVKETLHAWLNTFKDVNLAYLCKTITADNGLEFSEISNLENEILSIYFARHYSAWKRGSNESIMVYFVDVYRKECQ